MAHLGDGLDDTIVVDPEWLTGTLLASVAMPPLLRGKNGVATIEGDAATGRVSRAEIERAFPGHDAEALLKLCRHFDVCFDDAGGKGEGGEGEGGEGPAVPNMVLRALVLDPVWFADKPTVVGRRFACRSAADLFERLARDIRREVARLRRQAAVRRRPSCTSAPRLVFDSESAMLDGREVGNPLLGWRSSCSRRAAASPPIGATSRRRGRARACARFR